MAERYAAHEEEKLRETSRKFDAELTRIKRGIQTLFDRLHALLDKRKAALLEELKQINVVHEQNKEAEHAIRQLEAAMEGLVSTISSNLLRERKDHYSESLTRDIGEYRKKIQICPNIDTIQVLHNRGKFDEAMKSIEIRPDRFIEVHEEPRLIAGIQGEQGDLRRPRGVSVCPVSNTIFVSDRYNNSVKLFSEDGVYIRDIGGECLNSPWGVSVCEDALYVTEVGPKQVTKFRLSGELVKRTGVKGQREGEFTNARGLCATQEAVYVCDQGNNRVQVLTPELNFVSVISNTGLKKPVDVNVKNREITVLPLNDNTIFVFVVGGGLVRMVILDEEHVVREKYFFTVNKRGCFVVSSRLDGCLKIFSPHGHLEGTVGRGWAEDCYGVCMAGNGEGIVCVCNSSANGRLQIY